MTTPGPQIGQTEYGTAMDPNNQPLGTGFAGTVPGSDYGAPVPAPKITLNPGGPTYDPTQDITQLYQQDLGRAPDQGGLDFWTNAAKSGQSISDINQAFLNSPEYQALHANDVRPTFDPNIRDDSGRVIGTKDPGPTYDPTVAITQLYQQDLNRAPDQAGLDFWTNAAKSGQSISDINQAFLNSPEYQSLHANVPSTPTLPTFDPNIRDESGRIIGARDPAQPTIVAPSNVTVPDQQFAPDMNPSPYYASGNTWTDQSGNIQFDPYGKSGELYSGIGSGITQQAPVDPVSDFVKNLNQQPQYLQNAFQQQLARLGDPVAAARAVLGSLT